MHIMTFTTHHYGEKLLEICDMIWNSSVEAVFRRMKQIGAYVCNVNIYNKDEDTNLIQESGYGEKGVLKGKG